MQPVLVPSASPKGFFLRKALIFPVLRRRAQTSVPKPPRRGIVSFVLPSAQSPVCSAELYSGIKPSFMA